MPALTVSRLQEVVSAADAFDARLRGMHSRASESLDELFERFSTSVTEVNVALAEVREFLLAGLRDEALTIHGPELAAVARRLGLQDRSDWVGIHSWVLEHGMSVPDEVDVATADDLDAAARDLEVLERELDGLRRLVLERAPLEQRLTSLRALQALDPASPLWPMAITDCERAVVEEYDRIALSCHQRGDIDALASMEATLTDPAWGVPLTRRLLDTVVGATEARALRDCVDGAQAAADGIRERCIVAHPTAEAVDALVDLADRLEGTVAEARHHVASLAMHPKVQAIVRAAGLHDSCEALLQKVAPELARIRSLQKVRDTRRAFADGCRRIEHLCDHPPERSEVSRWSSGLQRAELDVRRCSQELVDLVMPPLLRERMVRAASAVESQGALRRRFHVVVVLTSVAALLGVTVLAAWWLWHSTERDRMLGELRSEVAAARAGHHQKRPPFVTRMVDRYGGDPLVASLVEDFDAGVDGERDRTRRFEEMIASLLEEEAGVTSAVAERLAAPDDTKLSAWPQPLVEAMQNFAEARAIGGFPENRGATVERSPPEARQRQQFEENRIASVEKNLAALDRRLEQAAVAVFENRLEALRAELVGSPTRAVIGRVRKDVASLRSLATSPRAEGGAAGPLARSRIPEDVVATLDALEERARTVGREASVNK